MKWIEKLFGVSLVLISLTSLVVTVTGLAAIPLPALAWRIIGAVNLISLPMLIYSAARNAKDRLKAKQTPAPKAGGKKKRKKKGKKK